MSSNSWIVLGLGLMLSAIGCGDSGGGGSAGNGTGGTGTGGTGGGGATATLSGIVSEAGEEGDGPVVEGAAVAVVGSSESTTTNAAGEYTLEVPVGDHFVMASAAGAWGTIELVDVPLGGAEYDFEVLPDALIDEVSEALDEESDTALGLVAVNFDAGENPAIGGETAELSVVPGFSFTFSDEGMPTLSDALLADGSSDLIFVNVPLTDDLAVTPTGAEGWTCVLEAPEAQYPVVAKTLIEVEVLCTEDP